MPKFLPPFWPADPTPPATPPQQPPLPRRSGRLAGRLAQLWQRVFGQRPGIGPQPTARSMSVVFASDAAGLPVYLPQSEAISFVNNGLQAGENQPLDTQNVTQWWDYTDLTDASVITLGSVLKNGTAIYAGYEVLGAPDARPGVTLSIWDATTASGTPLLVATALGGVGDFTRTVGIKCQVGITAQLSAPPAAGTVVRIQYRIGA